MPDSAWGKSFVGPGPATRGDRRPPFVERAARVAFTFLVLNYSAVAGLVAALIGKKVWR
jgi:hypothetical protein